MTHNLIVKCFNCCTLNHFESRRNRKWRKKVDDKPCLTCGKSVWQSYIYNVRVYPDAVSEAELSLLSDIFTEEIV